MTKSKVFYIGSSDTNADWIKSLAGHKEEMQIYKVLTRRYRKANQKAKDEEGTKQAGIDQNDAPKEA